MSKKAAATPQVPEVNLQIARERSQQISHLFGDFLASVERYVVASCGVKPEQLGTNKKVLTSRELAERWRMHPTTLANWRIQGRGPRFRKMGRKVVYLLDEIHSYEKTQERRSTVG